jgi:hypothetical protein
MSVIASINPTLIFPPTLFSVASTPFYIPPCSICIRVVTTTPLIQHLLFTLKLRERKREKERERERKRETEKERERDRSIDPDFRHEELDCHAFEYDGNEQPVQLET